MAKLKDVAMKMRAKSAQASAERTVSTRKPVPNVGKASGQLSPSSTTPIKGPDKGAG